MTKKIIDFGDLNNQLTCNSTGHLLSWFPAGKVMGRNFRVGNLAGDPGDSLCVEIDTGKWIDFATGECGGDLISLYAASNGINQVDSAKALFGDDIADNDRDTKPKTSNAKPRINNAQVNHNNDDWEPIIPAAIILPDTISHPKHGKPNRVFVLKDCNGKVLHAVCRWDGGPKALPLTYGRLGGRAGWHWRGPNKPRPLYGIDRLTNRKNCTIIICEGEKKADSVESIFSDYVGVSWTGGAQAVAATDWQPLSGRSVIIWPDNDIVGRDAAQSIIEKLTGIASSISLVDPCGQPEKWDVADAIDWSEDFANDWLDAHTKKITGDDNKNNDNDFINEMPAIVPLGYSGTKYYYLSKETGQILELAADKHNQSMLCHLASAAYYWERTVHMSKTGVNWSEAADELRTQCKQIGIFDPSRIRGRGAYCDNKRSIFHVGDQLIVDGNIREINSINSKFIYERRSPLKLTLGKPLKNHEAKKLADLCNLINFISPDMCIILSGWLAIAPICSALKYRPHIWMTSSAGVGKTWIMTNIIGRALSGVAVSVSSKTTESGIRAKLKSDGLPIIFDEAETQSKPDRERMQAIIDLARLAYSDDGDGIVKSNPGGDCLVSNIRSPFLFSSIQYSITQSADESRFIHVKLASQDSKEQSSERVEKFNQLKKSVIDVLNDEFSGRLITRTCSLIPVIIKNSETFASAIAEIYGSRRQGDTIGTILAGYASLHHGNEIKYEDALEFVKDRQWVSKTIERTAVVHDYQYALQYLIEQKIRIVIPGNQYDIPIERLISVAIGLDNGDTQSYTPSKDLALDALLSNGIKFGVMDNDGATPALILARSHDAINRLFENSRWGASWADVLLQTPGSEVLKKAQRFRRAMKRGIAIPMDNVLCRE